MGQHRRAFLVCASLVFCLSGFAGAMAGQVPPAKPPAKPAPAPVQNQQSPAPGPGGPAAGRIIPDQRFPVVERNVGIAVENLCPGLVERSSGGLNAPGSAERDLQVRCTEVVRARENGASDDELRNVLRQFTAEEVATQGTGLVELAALRSVTVLSRLEQLRTASVPGSLLAYDEPAGALQFGYGSGAAAGDPGFGRWSMYLNGNFATGDRDETDNEAGFDFDAYSLSIGADYRIGNNAFAGAGLSYRNLDADLSNGGSLEADSLAATVYATYFHSSGFYVEGTVGYGESEYDQARRIRYTLPGTTGPGAISVDQTAVADPDGEQVSASIGAGKDFGSGKSILTLSAYLNYLDAEIDRFRETLPGTGSPGFGLALEVAEQEIESLRSVVGLQGTTSTSSASGVWTFSIYADWIHEFENEARVTQVRFARDPFAPRPVAANTTFALTTDGPDEDYARLGAGVSKVWAGGWQGFVSLDSVLGLENIDNLVLSGGVRREL